MEDLPTAAGPPAPLGTEAATAGSDETPADGARPSSDPGTSGHVRMAALAQARRELAEARTAAAESLRREEALRAQVSAAEAAARQRESALRADYGVRLEEARAAVGYYASQATTAAARLRPARRSHLRWLQPSSHPL